MSFFPRNKEVGESTYKTSFERHIERRRYLRVHTKNLMKICQEGLSQHIVNLVDISQGGVQFSSRARIEPETTFPFVLNLTELSKQVRVVGKVIWTCGRISTENKKYYRCGLAFLELAQNDQDILQTFIQMKVHRAH